LFREFPTDLIKTFQNFNTLESFIDEIQVLEKFEPPKSDVDITDILYKSTKEKNCLTDISIDFDTRFESTKVPS